MFRAFTTFMVLVAVITLAQAMLQPLGIDLIGSAWAMAQEVTR